MMTRAKIKKSHLQRHAVVYLRQSTLKQVHVHRESTERQYALDKRALDLGWAAETIDIIDEDLGKSGASTEKRPGFQRLAEDVSRGRVGAIFSLEVSRLARSSADWHRLLDLCGWADVLIADEQAVFAPNDVNDRLLLGLKGQMSEAERYWLRLRLHGARQSKARRGELRLHAPVGYVWDHDAGRLQLDPDAEIQQAVRLIFERFRIDRTGGAVVAYFIRNGLDFPRRRADGEIQRGRLGRAVVVRVLHSPIYTGAYVYGRREYRTTLSNGQLKRNQVARLPMAEWKACLQEKHPAYTTWEEFVANQQQLDENRNRRKHARRPGSARNGSALLQGLILCGRCGAHMTVQQGGKALPRYICTSQIERGNSTKACWSVTATTLDRRVAEQFLAAATPPQLELALAVTREVENQAAKLEQQWRARLERASYEVQLAERRYKAVDPGNRVVAGTLEHEWETRLAELQALKRDFERAQQSEKVTLTASDRAAIFALAGELEHVWDADTTTNTQRKNLIRQLIERVTLIPIDIPRRSMRAKILWHSGTVTELVVDRPRGNHGHRTSEHAIEQVRRRVARGETDAAIARALNEDGIAPANAEQWTIKSVRGVRERTGIRSTRGRAPAARYPAQRGDGLFSLRGVAERFNVDTRTVRRWRARALLVPTEGGGQGQVQYFTLDDDTVRRLSAELGALEARPQREPAGGES